MISSVTVLYNNEDDIESHLANLGFAEEHFLIDTTINKRTANIHQRYNAKIYSCDIDIISDHKLSAIKESKNPWIITFVIGESVSKALATEIKSKIESRPNAQGYRIKRNFYFMGKLMKYAHQETKPVVRILRKSSILDKNVDDIQTEQIHNFTEVLKNRLDYSYGTFDAYNKKLTLQSRQEAKILYKNNLRPNFYHFILRPFFEFWHHYLIRLGFMDGKEGFILAYLKGFAVMKTYLLLWTMYRNID